MYESIYYAKCAVPENGFHIDTPDKLYPGNALAGFLYNEKVTTEKCLIPNNYEYVSSYNMFDYADKALFKVFTALSSDSEIIEFANNYGYLGTEISTGINAPPVETIFSWEKHIKLLKQASELWDNIQANNLDWLNDRVTWRHDKNNGKSVIYDDGVYQEWIAGKGRRNDDLVGRLKYGETRIPARICLQSLINNQMNERVRLVLMYDYELSEQRVFAIPNSLLGFLWLQLAQAIESNIIYRKCATCKIPFVARNERGNKKKYCRDACKSSYFRKKKKREVKE